MKIEIHKKTGELVFEGDYTNETEVIIRNMLSDKTNVKLVDVITSKPTSTFNGKLKTSEPCVIEIERF